MLTWLLACAFTALWFAGRRPYRVAPAAVRPAGRRGAAPAGAAVLALSLALDVSGAGVAHPLASDHYLEIHAPAAWTAATSGFDGWMV